MAKIYFPTFDRDVKINSGKELQLKSSVSGKLLSECELGEIVYLPETINGVKDFHDYIVVEKNDNNVVLLRKYVASGDSGILVPNESSKVYGNYYISNLTDSADYWCENTFYNRFSDSTKTYITTKVIKVISNRDNGATSNYIRKVFLPSIDELGGTPNIGSGEGTSIWFTSNADRVALSETDKTTAVQYWTRTLHNFEYSFHYTSYYYYDYVSTNGSFAQINTPGTTSKPYRPAIVFLPNTPLNGSNQFVDEVTYTDTIDTIKFGDDLYRIKDTEARGLIDTKQDALPNGINVGDMIMWDGTKWAVAEKWQIIFNPIAYLQSSGTQYIDTGMTGINGVIIDMEIVGTPSNDNGFFGSLSSNTSNRYDIVYYNGLYFSCGNGSSTSQKIIDDALLNTRITIEQGVTDDDLKVNGTTIHTYSSFTNTGTYKALLFARNQNGSIGKGSVKIYSCKLYKDRVMVNDFIPVINNLSGNAGMYDKVTQLFHSNAGTGSFIIPT